MTRVLLGSVSSNVLQQSDLLSRYWALFLLLLIAIPLLTINLHLAPYPWFDEGLNLAAVRTFAETGAYALPSSDELRFSDPAIQTGPPVLLPLSLLYRLVGADIGFMRLMIVISGLVALVLVYSLSQQLFGQRSALLSTLLLLLLPGMETSNFIMMSRQVLGEVPAIVYVLLGLMVLHNRPLSRWHWLSVGVLFGLAVTIKSQILVVLSVTLLVFLLAALIRRQWSVAGCWLLLIVAMVAVYLIDWLWRSSMGSMPDSTETLIQGIRIHILTFQPLQNFTDFNVLWRVALGLLSAGAFVILEGRDLIAPERRVARFIVVFVVLWMLWYSLFSIGWPRYAFVGLIFALLLLGRVVSRLLKRRSFPWTMKTCSMLLLAGALGAGLIHGPQLTDTRAGDDFFAMMRYLREEVPSDARIVTWEWLATFLTDQQYVLPSTAITNEITAHVFLGQPYDIQAYDSLATCPDYLLYGSFVVDRTVLQVAQPDAAPVFERGWYQLYAVEGCD